MGRPRDALPEGSKLGGYVIGAVLGRGGFAITYLSRDALFPDTKVAIKEFMPVGLAVRDPGGVTVHPAGPGDEADYRAALARFEEEARTLVALRHPNVVEVQRFIEANGTAYVVMKYESGRALDDLLGGGRTLSADELADLIPPLLDGVEAIHARHFLHRDIKPGNIFIRASDGSPVLLDFGAARVAMGVNRETSFTQELTPGYAPFEQYSRKGNQGPWTDIHALGATFYRCISGQRPPDALDRVRGDDMVPAREIGRGRYPEALLSAIDAMLVVDETKRPQRIADVRALLAATPRQQQQTRAASTLVAGTPPAPPAAAAPTPAMPPWPQPSPPSGYKWPPLTEENTPSAPPPPEARPGAWILALAIVAAFLAALYFAGPASEPEPAAVSAPAGAPDACRQGSGWRAGCAFRDCPDCPEMVVVPAGTFLMGSTKDEDWRANYVGPQPEPSPMFSLLKFESPQRRVTIAKPFAMARYETKFSEYDACHAAGSCAHRPDDKGWGRGQRPVINVEGADVRSYLAWLSNLSGKGYRLPSEAEWEYAARAGSTTRFSWGDEPGHARANCWSCGSEWDNKRTSPVGSFAPNAFGLHDMHGNVWELTRDCWNDNHVGAHADGTARLSGDCSKPVLRGGGWGNNPGSIRSAVRIGQDMRSDLSGFRVVRPLD